MCRTLIINLHLQSILAVNAPVHVRRARLAAGATGIASPQEKFAGCHQVDKQNSIVMEALAMHSVAWLSTVCPRLPPAFWRGLDRRAILPLLGGGVTRSTHCVEMATREQSRHLPVHAAAWRAGRRGRCRQPLLSRARCQGLADAAALGSLRHRCRDRRQHGAPELACMARRSREKAPSEQPPVTKRWETEHQVNLSGTPQAYVPPGHEHRGGQRAKATGDYEAWRP